MTKQFHKKLLRCGCCGMDFYTWKGYEDQGQDRGYGICSECQGIKANNNISRLKNKNK